MTKIFVINFEDMTDDMMLPDNVLVLSDEHTPESRNESIQLFLVDFLHEEDVTLTFLANPDNAQMAAEAAAYGAELVAIEDADPLNEWSSGIAF